MEVEAGELLLVTLSRLNLTVPAFNSNAINYYSCLKELLNEDSDKNKSFLRMLDNDHIDHDEFLMNKNKNNVVERENLSSLVK